MQFTEENSTLNSASKIGKALFIACWAVYCVSYMGRLNYSAVLSVITSQGIFFKSEAGLIGTVYFICYAAGQITSGIMGDRVSPYKMIGTGLGLTAAANFAMPFCSFNHLVMAAVWGFNGLAQSMLWTPILFIISNVLPAEQRNRACLYIAASYPVGSVFSYITSTLCIRFATWRMAFIIPASLMLLILAVWICVALKAEHTLGHKRIDISSSNKGRPVNRIKTAELISACGAVIICIGILIHGMLKDGVSSWVPTLITEIYKVPPFLSVALSTLLPIVNLSGAWFATKLLEKASNDNEITVTLICFVISLVPLAGLLFVGKYPIGICILLFAVFTSLIVAINHMFITVIPVRFAKYGCTSTIGGIFNAMTYLGCAISTYGFGAISEKLGWTATIISWLILGLAGVLSCAAVLRKYKRFITT